MEMLMMVIMSETELLRLSQKLKNSYAKASGTQLQKQCSASISDLCNKPRYCGLNFTLSCPRVIALFVSIHDHKAYTHTHT